MSDPQDDAKYAQADAAARAWKPSFIRDGTGLLPRLPTADEIASRRENPLSTTIHRDFSKAPEANMEMSRAAEMEMPLYLRPKDIAGYGDGTCQIGGSVPVRIAAFVSCGRVGDFELTDAVINADWTLAWVPAIPYFRLDSAGSFTLISYNPGTDVVAVTTTGTFVITAVCLDGLWSGNIFSNDVAFDGFISATPAARGMESVNSVACGGLTTFIAGGTFAVL